MQIISIENQKDNYNTKYLCNKMCVMEQNISSSCQFCILSTTIYTCQWWAQHVFFKYSVGMLPVSFFYMHVNTPNVLKLLVKRVLFAYRCFNFWYFHTSIVLFVGLRLRYTTVTTILYIFICRFTTLGIQLSW